MARKSIKEIIGSPLKKMSYEEYSRSIKGEAILVDNKTNIATVNPDYKYVLTKLELDPSRCEEPITWSDVFEILSLEADGWTKLNGNVNKFLATFAQYLTEDFAEDLIAKMVEDKRKEVVAQKEADETISKYNIPQIDYSKRD